MLDQQQDVGRVGPDAPSTQPLYRRQLPGGGYVEVELTMAESPLAGTRHRGRVIVERRSDLGRRLGHQPPVIAEVIGDDADELTSELFRLARDNVALARGLLDWQAARVRAD